MFTVIWRDTALDQLADVYVAADSDTRDRIAKAVDAFNRRLASNPLAEGEARGGRYRIAFPDGLAVVFRVDTGGVVRVVAAARYGW